MVLAALAVILLLVVGIFFQPPMWVMGCGVILAVLCVFLGD